MVVSDASSIVLVYDGDCPVCSAYSRAIALRHLDPGFQLLNAREPHPIVREIDRLGFDMDEGFVLKIKDDYYHGADAINRLALMTTRAGAFNRINYYIFGSRFLSRLLYPVLRTGRNALLCVLGKTKIAASGS
jgi:predicted DCC family thiol-disulfide oxidoreductase YuxK